MANLAPDRNPMIRLTTTEKPKEDPLKVEPLSEQVLFEKKEGKKVTIQEPEKIHVEEPLKKQKPAQKRKKRVLSEAHKEKLRQGRLKGLETRRRKAQERKMRAEQLLKEKETAYTAKISQKADREHERTLKLAKKLQNKQARIPYEKKQIQKATTSNPDAEFQKFYTMMNRYESIKIKQYKEAMAKKAKVQKEKQAKQPKTAPKKITSVRSFYRNGSNRFNNKQQVSNAGTNPYLKFYS